MSSQTISSTDTVSYPEPEPQAASLIISLDTAVKSATEAAIATAFHWGSPVNRENRAAGGLCWATYKAICRRNGIYTNSQGPHVSTQTSKLRLHSMEEPRTDLVP